MHWAWRHVVEAGKITSGSRAARRFAFFGEGSAIAFPQGTVLGERWISVGHFTLIGPQVTISAGFVPERDLGPDPIVRIGNGVVLGRGSHVVGHQSIDIGDDVYTGPYIYVTDQNHGYTDPDTPIGKQWPVNEPVLHRRRLLDRHRRRDPPRRRHRPQCRRRRGLRRARRRPRPLRRRRRPARVVRRLDETASGAAPAPSGSPPSPPSASPPPRPVGPSAGSPPARRPGPLSRPRVPLRRDR